jgi:hypothetical protein
MGIGLITAWSQVRTARRACRAHSHNEASGLSGSFGLIRLVIFADRRFELPAKRVGTEE